MRTAGLFGVIGAIALLFGISHPGSAQEDVRSANWILPGCRSFVDGKVSTDLGFKAGVCAGVVGTFRDLGGAAVPPYCIPDAVVTGQAVRVVVTFIERNPARMHESFSVLVLDAFRSAWPCKP
jgi:Rap1a immunity proteins